MTSIFTTVGNYDHGFYWYLYLDGSIEFESKLTGILSTGALESEDPRCGRTLAPGLSGLDHQHFFAMRLDMNIDGPANKPQELEAEMAPAEVNTCGKAWVEGETQLTQRIDGPADRKPADWPVLGGQERRDQECVGHGVWFRNRTGRQPGVADVQQHPRSGVVQKHLWTPGCYRSGALCGGGLRAPEPRKRRAPQIRRRQPVLGWGGAGGLAFLCAHHAPRPEVWPATPAATVEFDLKPSGFFEGSAMVDYPEDTQGPPAAAPQRAAAATESCCAGEVDVTRCLQNKSS